MILQKLAKNIFRVFKARVRHLVRSKNMQITPIKNQNNRTNFSGWKKVVANGQLIHTERLFDKRILDLIPQIKSEQVIKKTETVSYFHPSKILLEDGTQIEYSRSGGSFTVTHDKLVKLDKSDDPDKPEGLLDSTDCCFWSATELDARQLGLFGEFTKAKMKIEKLLGI